MRPFRSAIGVSFQVASRPVTGGNAVTSVDENRSFRVCTGT